jgi:hypothetical protein
MKGSESPTVADLAQNCTKDTELAYLTWRARHLIMHDHIDQATYIVSNVSRLSWRIPWKGGQWPVWLK